MSNVFENLKKQVSSLAEGVVEDDQAAARAAEAASILADLCRLENRAKRLLDPVTDTRRSRQPTLEEVAATVLKGAGEPLHARELGKRIRASGWTHPRSVNPSPDQIYFQLAARLPNHPDRFRKVAPATWALVSTQS